MKLSIITINFNNRDGLRKTIESVVNQTWQEFEYIIIDGGSTDGSVEVIKEYAARIDYWVSEPDKGIYDAMNKGIDQAKGEYCLFMNSGDCIYRPTTLEEVYTELDGSDIINGHVFFSNGAQQRSPSEIRLSFFYRLNSLPHQASFIATNLLKQRHYDTQYKIVSDYKFYIETLIQNQATYKMINSFIAMFDYNGISSSNVALRKQEQLDVLAKLFPNQILSDYHTLTHGDTYEDKLYLVIKAHKLHQVFYTFNILIFKLFSLFSKRTAQWIKEFPFKI